MSETEMVVISDAAIMPVMAVAQAVQRHKVMAKLVSDLMVREHDYGLIPGTGDKPSLLKPGAEKLNSFFGLRPVLKLVDAVEDWDRGVFSYRYACELWRNGELIASTEGSANSKEKKYRWRRVFEWEATADDKARAVRTETKTGKKGPYKVYVIENDDPYSLINTLQKMAQKRALVGSTLLATNASDFFTQDVEDLAVGAVEAEWHVIDEPPTTKAEPTPAPKAAPTNGDAQHWIKDDKKRAAFWARTAELGLTNVEVHKALGVEHVENFGGTIQDAGAAIRAYIAQQEKGQVEQLAAEVGGVVAK